MTNYQGKPYAQWIEKTVSEVFEIDPVSIAMQMRDAEGQTYTCYWDCSSDDFACMQDALRDDSIFEMLRNNKETLRAILEDEEDDDSELLGPDTETDREG